MKKMAIFKKNKEPEMVEREDGLIDYDVYVMSKNERIMYTVLAYVIIFIVGYIFYENIILAALLGLLGLFFPKIRTKQIIKARKNALSVEFKDWLYSLASSMSAGRSIETAFKESYRDLEIIYPNPDTPIMQELQHMIRCLEMNETVETVVLEFAERTHIEDIESFGEVIKISKRSGGNLVDVIRSTSNIIGDKIETKQDIETTISGKKFESRILCCMPVVMIALLTATSYDYMEKVFTTFVGHAAMTVSIIMFVAAFFIGEKIMDIEV